jgi:hypothetical protein
MTFRFRFVSRDWAGPGSVTRTRIENKILPRAQAEALFDCPSAFIFCPSFICRFASFLTRLRLADAIYSRVL